MPTMVVGLRLSTIMLLSLFLSLILPTFVTSVQEGHTIDNNSENDGLDFFYSARPKASRAADIFKQIYANHHITMLNITEAQAQAKTGNRTETLSPNAVSSMHCAEISTRSGSTSTMTRCLPSFIIIGATKAGTTALHDAVSLLPHARVISKEAHFFEKQTFFLEKNAAHYLSRFPIDETSGPGSLSSDSKSSISSSSTSSSSSDSDNESDDHNERMSDLKMRLVAPIHTMLAQAAATEEKTSAEESDSNTEFNIVLDRVGEKTPGYLWKSASRDRGYTARHTHEYVPHARLIAVLRDPVDRAYSHFRYFHRKKDAAFKDLSEEQLAETFHSLVERKISEVQTCLKHRIKHQQKGKDQQSEQGKDNSDMKGDETKSSETSDSEAEWMSEKKKQSVFFDIRNTFLVLDKTVYPKLLEHVVSMADFAFCLGNLNVGESHDEDLLAIGAYAFWLQSWYQYYDREQILVLFTNELTTANHSGTTANHTTADRGNGEKGGRVLSVMERLEQHVGLPPYSEANNIEFMANTAASSHSLQFTMKSETKALMEKFYEPLDQQLRTLLSLDRLPWDADTQTDAETKSEGLVQADGKKKRQRRTNKKLLRKQAVISATSAATQTG